MLLFLIIIAFFVLLIISDQIFSIKELYPDNTVTGFSVLLLSLFITFSLLIRHSNNPEADQYLNLKERYSYFITQDSVPFNIKSELYDEIKYYNECVDNNINNKDNIWIGFYYPKNNYPLPKFDLNKIK